MHQQGLRAGQQPCPSSPISEHCPWLPGFGLGEKHSLQLQNDVTPPHPPLKLAQERFPRKKHHLTSNNTETQYLDITENRITGSGAVVICLVFFFSKLKLWIFFPSLIKFGLLQIPFWCLQCSCKRQDPGCSSVPMAPRLNNTTEGGSRG